MSCSFEGLIEVMKIGYTYKLKMDKVWRRIWPYGRQTTALTYNLYSKQNIPATCTCVSLWHNDVNVCQQVGVFIWKYMLTVSCFYLSRDVVSYLSCMPPWLSLSAVILLTNIPYLWYCMHGPYFDKKEKHCAYHDMSSTMTTTLNVKAGTIGSRGCPSQTPSFPSLTKA